MMNNNKHKSCQQGIISVILTLSIITLSTNTNAESLADFTSMTESFIVQNLDAKLKNPSINVQAPLNKVDKPICSHLPNIHQTNSNKIGNISVVISCNSPTWQQRMSAIVDGDYAVVMSKVDIAANTILSEKMMIETWIPANRLRPNYYTQLKDIQNKTSKRFIAANSILAENMLKNTQFIQKNQEVNVIVQQGGLSIELRAIAIESGEHNQLIKLKNATSGKLLQGKVISADTVIVE